MPIPIKPINQKNVNNPSREILSASGLYSNPQSTNYAEDKPNSPAPNWDTASTTTQQPTLPSARNALADSDLRNGNYFIDDMQVFNNYIHYSANPTTLSAIQFNPQAFLQQSIVTFNIYSLEYRQ